jgi:hypothetical protein
MEKGLGFPLRPAGESERKLMRAANSGKRKLLSKPSRLIIPSWDFRRRSESKSSLFWKWRRGLLGEGEADGDGDAAGDGEAGGLGGGETPAADGFEGGAVEQWEAAGAG